MNYDRKRRSKPTAHSVARYAAPICHGIHMIIIINIVCTHFQRLNIYIVLFHPYVVRNSLLRKEKKTQKKI